MSITIETIETQFSTFLASYKAAMETVASLKNKNAQLALDNKVKDDQIAALTEEVATLKDKKTPDAEQFMQGINQLYAQFHPAASKTVVIATPPSTPRATLKRPSTVVLSDDSDDEDDSVAMHANNIAGIKKEFNESVASSNPPLNAVTPAVEKTPEVAKQPQKKRIRLPVKPTVFSMFKRHYSGMFNDNNDAKDTFEDLDENGHVYKVCVAKAEEQYRKNIASYRKRCANLPPAFLE